MAQKKKAKKKGKALAKRRPAAKKKAMKARGKPVRRKPIKKLVKETPVQLPQPVQSTVQEATENLEARQEEIHDAEDAIVDEAEEVKLGM